MILLHMKCQIPTFRFLLVIYAFIHTLYKANNLITEKTSTMKFTWDKLIAHHTVFNLEFHEIQLVIWLQFEKLNSQTRFDVI